MFANAVARRRARAGAIDLRPGSVPKAFANRVRGQAWPIGSLPWRRNAAESTLLTTMSTAWQRRGSRHRSGLATGHARTALSARRRSSARLRWHRNATGSKVADNDRHGVAAAPAFPPPR
jgi:hypothetical protein